MKRGARADEEPLRTAAGPAEEVVEQLRRAVQRIEVARRQSRADGSGGDERLVSSGCAALDGLLPEGGFPRGALVEWLGTAGSGAGMLALLAAREAARPTRPLFVLDPRACFFPPAAVACGVAPEQLFLVRPATAREALWALDQALRCSGVAAVWAPLERIDARAFRRLQLAAEEGGSLGLLLRPPAARRAPSWAELQLLVTATSSVGATGLVGAGRRWRIELTRGRGDVVGRAIEIEMDAQNGEVREVQRDEAHRLCGVPALAHSAAGRREARA